jgi:thiol-disulfide isomerase/thioredoxin
MSLRQNTRLPALLFLVCALAAHEGQAAEGAIATRAESGAVMADSAQAETESSALGQLLRLKLVDARQQSVDLATWQGRIRVINLWATWCGPCKEEMPAFSRLQEKLQAQGVQFVGIAVDSAANVQRFAEKYPVSYPLPIGGDDILPLSQKLGNSYMGLPFTLVVDAQGRILTRKSGRLEEATLEALLQQAIKDR